MPAVDVVGVGLNATDTLILVPKLPPYSGKAPFTEDVLSPGGQVASALVACARLGLRTRYIGTVGDDERGRVQMDSLLSSGIDLTYVQRRHGPNQSAYIIVDGESGERTVFWRREDCLRIDPEEITPEQIADARMLHIDGHDTAAVAHAAAIARSEGIPVSVDVDTIYPGFENVLPNVDYLVASQEFPTRWTGERDPLRALALIQAEYGMRVAAMTLGDAGSLARVDGRYIYSPAFAVDCVDTTGAGDVFHGAFCYSVLQVWPVGESLRFANAMAALNCMALGARGGIQSLDAVERLLATGERRVRSEIAERADEIV